MVSVIVPAYKAAKYIKECLNSLAAALEETDELLVCVEASGDSTMEIVRRFAESNKTVRVVPVEGKGPSVARNRGLDLAKGEYILFSDADDYVYSETLKKLLRHEILLRQHDVFVTDIYRSYPSGSTQVAEQIGHRSLQGLESLPKILESRSCFWNVQRCIYRRSFLEDNKIRFPLIDRGEDIDFFTQVLLAKPDIIFLDSPFYCYRMDNLDSIMTAPSLPRLQETVEVLEKCIEELEEAETSWAKAAADVLRCEYVRIMAHGWEIKRRDRNGESVRLFENYRNVLAGSGDSMAVCARLMLRVMGLRPFMTIMGMARRTKRKLERRNY